MVRMNNTPVVIRLARRSSDATPAEIRVFPDCIAVRPARLRGRRDIAVLLPPEQALALAALLDEVGAPHGSPLLAGALRDAVWIQRSMCNQGLSLDEASVAAALCGRDGS